MSQPQPAQIPPQQLLAGMECLRLDLEELKAALLRLNHCTDQLLTELRANRGREP